jgi:hypothetical protein
MQIRWRAGSDPVRHPVYAGAVRHMDGGNAGSLDDFRYVLQGNTFTGHDLNPAGSLAHQLC